MAIDVNAMGGRFAGAVVSVGPKFAFVRLDESEIDVFLHRDICVETVPWQALQLGDRLTFEMRRSTRYPDKFVAGRVARETKI